MKVVVFGHSLISCWNHGNAHFLRGVVSELRVRGHEVVAWEPIDGWSITHLLAESDGQLPLDELDAVFPALRVHDGGIVRYDPQAIDVDAALDGADLVLVHEWNDPDLVSAIGRRRAQGGRFLLLFHDTHHRSITAPDTLARFDLAAYDGVLAFGDAVREVYERRGWGPRAFTWHEAADVRVFRPLQAPRTGDLAWVGNWGDDERTSELQTFLLEPVVELGLSADVHGVRYPDDALATFARAGIRTHGWVPNHRVPEVFAAHTVTVHVPRRPYARALPGIPTIRVFEALACGIPLVCAPWDDVEALFTPGLDYLVARDGQEMREHLRALLADPELRQALSRHGRATILARHSCAHRVDELLTIVAELRGTTTRSSPHAPAVTGVV